MTRKERKMPVKIVILLVVLSLIAVGAFSYCIIFLINFALDKQEENRAALVSNVYVNGEKVDMTYDEYMSTFIK